MITFPESCSQGLCLQCTGFNKYLLRVLRFCVFVMLPSLWRAVGGLSLRRPLGWLTPRSRIHIVRLEKVSKVSGVQEEQG